MSTDPIARAKALCDEPTGALSAAEAAVLRASLRALVAEAERLRDLPLTRSCMCVQYADRIRALEAELSGRDERLRALRADREVLEAENAELRRWLTECVELVDRLLGAVRALWLVPARSGEAMSGRCDQCGEIGDMWCTGCACGAWTTERPTEPGLYAIQSLEDMRERFFVKRVLERDGKLQMHVDDAWGWQWMDDIPLVFEDFKLQWLRLPEPPE